jgi:hypothetical protein
MAYKNLLTYGSKISQVEQVYYSPVAVLPVTGLPISTVYCFLSRVDAWGDDTNPPQPTQDQKYIKNVFKNIFVAKQITTNNISPVAQRIDWTSGVTYDYYQDNIDMFQTDSNGFLILQFYVRNRYDQIFKCLWNNNGQPATVEPIFQPGAFNVNNIYTGSDGYKWKYLYTIDVGSKQKFFDSNWMPVPVGQNTPNPVSTPAGFGDIEVINVTNGGSGYDPANAQIYVTVTGDGTGASGVITTSGGSITDIVLTGTGSNYTYANVTITSAIGSNATAISPVSPVGGHGFDPISELGVSRAALICEFNGTETYNGVDYVPTDIDYRQVGVLVAPIDYNTYPNPANSFIYKTTTDVVVASGFGSYTSDETAYQGTSLATASFSATVLSFDSAHNTVKLINTTGTVSNNTPLFSTVTNTARTVLGSSTPILIPFSGYLAYIQNRSGITRSADGIEQFKFILSY